MRHECYWKERWEELRKIIFDWQMAYPEDVFPPLPAYDPAVPDNFSRDRVAGAMGRHILTRLKEDMERIEKN